jgi:hypothetical protein
MADPVVRLPGGIFVPHGRWTAQRALAELPVISESVIEVVDGSLVVSPRLDPLHQIVVMRLCHVLDKAARRAGMEALPELDLVVGDDLACPDIVVLPRVDVHRPWIDAAEVSLVGEVWSARGKRPCRFVRPEKYAGAGIRHYLRVEFRGDDPVIFLHELADGAYRPVAVAAAGSPFLMREPFQFGIDPAALVER